MHQLIVSFFNPIHFPLSGGAFGKLIDKRQQRQGFRIGKEEGRRGYDYWIDLFEELSTKLDTSATDPQ